MNPTTPENHTFTTTAAATHRIGKIARLPVEIRHELNERLADNEPGDRILRWLNRQPEVKEVLADLFDGRPISQQNLSAWKLGGFRDWERHQRTRALARDFLDEAEELENEVWEEHEEGRRSLLDRVSDRMALALLQLFREAEESEPGPTRTKAMLEISKEVARLRRGDHVRQRTAMLQERWEAEQNEALNQKEKEYAQNRMHDIAMLSTYASAFYSDYIAGLARETISVRRQEAIRQYFAVNEKELVKLGWKLPEGQELEAMVAAERERLRKAGELPQEEDVEEQRDPAAPLRSPQDDAGKKVENAGETSLHKAAQGETRQENPAE